MSNSNLILKQLINGRQHSNFILIQDDEYFQGIEFAKHFVTENINRNNKVHLFAFEKDLYTNFEDLKYNKLFSFYPCCIDPWKWINPSADDHALMSAEYVKNKLEIGVTNLILIDSLSYTLLTWSLFDLCQKLQNIIKLNNDECRVQIIGIFHTDSNNESNEFKQLKYMANTNISLETTSQGIKTEVIHKKHPGKLIKENYHSKIKPDGTLEYSIIKSESVKAPETGPDPTKLTTFKLSLEDNEKKSRNEVVLPYLKNVQNNKGTIYYEPDANDDWDEEDPDDDLEI